MDKPHRSVTGAVVAPCSDDDTCEISQCELCLKELPTDAVKIADAQDYVHHFCGLDCLAAWQKRAKARQ
ncbi:MAG: DUF3330 domain-containing protein [Thiobacillus sp.]